MGAFDDLIPNNPPTPEAIPVGDNAFSDLMPAPVAAAPEPQASPFEDLVPPIHPSAGAYPASENKPDVLAHPGMTDILSKLTQAADFMTPGGAFLPALRQGVVAGSKDLIKTAQVLTGETKPEAPPTAPPSPNPYSDPFALSDLLDPGLAVNKAAYKLGTGAPTIVGGGLAGLAGGYVAGPPGAILGGSLGAGVTTAAQTLGPTFQQELNKSPDDPEGAWERAKHEAYVSGVFSAAGWAAFSIPAFQGPVKQMLFQAAGIQPGIAASEQIYKNREQGKPLLENAVPAAVEGGIMTLVPMAGHGLISHFNGPRPGPTQEEVRAAFNDLRGTEPPTAEPPPPAAPPGAPPGAPPAPLPLEPHGTQPPATDVSSNVIDFLSRKKPKLAELSLEATPTDAVAGKYKGNNGESITITRNEDGSYSARSIGRNGVIGSETPPLNEKGIRGYIEAFGAERVKEAGPTASSDLTAPLGEEITAKPGANTGRLAKLLGAKLYGEPADMPAVTVKELFQNSFDALKATIDSGEQDHGTINIHTDPQARTITMHDNGAGMTPEILATKFLEIAGTHKETDRASGGLGIAKMLFLFANKGLKVITMRDGKVARLASTGDDLLAAMQDPSKAPKVVIGKPTAKESALFPEGHGTVVEVTVPTGYEDHATGERRAIYFPRYADEYRVLRNSPLLTNIDVNFNGEPVEGMGTKFNANDYTNFANVKFGWGDARIYVSRDPTHPVNYNAHILSNGLWQFSEAIKQDPTQHYGPSVPRTFYVDLSPKARPEDPGYPFDLNRQQFTAKAKEDLQKIFNYVSALYRHEDFRNSAANFGTMYYLDSPSKGTLFKSKTITLEPKKPADNPVTLIKPGDKVSVVDGKITVNGREVPELTPEDVKKMAPDVNELIVPQDEINPRAVMVHDNTMVKLSDVESKSITELAREKFGFHFEGFLHDVGQAFIDLRDVVAKALSYEALSKEAVGVSFDKEYRGVSIRVPFSGSFINPAIPEFRDTLRAAVGIVGTMVHELAHHMARSHDASFPAEMQRILIHLDTHPEFDFHAFKQRVVDVVAKNKEIFDYINNFYTGAYDLGTRGRSFEDPGSNEARTISLPRTRAPGSYERPGAPDVPPEARPGAASAPEVAGRSEFPNRVASGGTPRLVTEFATNERNLHGLDPGIDAPYPQAELIPIKDAVKKALPQGPTPPQVTSMGVHADKMNKMFKWWFGLDRLSDRNPRFTPLLRYRERAGEMRLDAAKIHDAALRIAKQWRRLGNRAEPLAALIDEVANMTYRTPDEVRRGVARLPTKPEFDALVAKHGVDAEALSVFSAQRKFFATFLELSAQNAREAAQRLITDPVALMKKLDAINVSKQHMSERPYFPFTRFGSHFITVRDKTGAVVYFETYERRGLRSAERVQQAAKAELQRKFPQHTVTDGVLPESAVPFVGLPPELLESIARELNLTPHQRDALDQIRYQFSPASSFAHHFQNKNYVPGYSHDFLRAFSRYAFHGARYYSRTKYAWALKAEIANARKVPGNTAGAIANYMEDHFHNAVLDAKGDFGLLKGGIFMWVFGYAPAGALINMSQVPLLSFPFLAAKFGGLGFGDARATKALVKAMVDMRNFYKKGSYDNATAFEMRALDYGIKSGRISEAMASELAGLAQGNNLLGLGNNAVSRGFHQFMEKAAFLFEMAEQFNRRVTYRAALDLAMQHPDSVGVKEALNKYADEFAQLQASGFNPVEARAIVSAIHATEQTQFVYSRDTRPRVARGRLAGTILVFKTYMLNVLQVLGANKTSVLPRYMLMMMAASGLMGLPGAEDIGDIVKILGKWFFGKDFDPKLALRQLILDLGGEKISPDLVLNGLSRKGFGVPALLDMMGENPGRGLGIVPDSPQEKAIYQQYALGMQQKGGVPMSYEAFRRQHSQNIPAPQFDLSRSLGMGRILPVNLGQLADPGRDPNQAIAASAQQASGAIFSVGFNMYKAFQDTSTSWTDARRWEKMMPRALASASRSFRAFNEGRDRTKGGPSGASTLVNYDVRDPEQMAEVIGLGLGLTPTRVNAQWDSIMAQQDLLKMYKTEKALLGAQMFEAQAGKNKEEIARVLQAIKDYNNTLPKWAKGEAITSQGLRASVQEHFKTKAFREAGVPRQRGDVPVARHVQGLFPESVVDVRPVK